MADTLLTPWKATMVLVRHSPLALLVGSYLLYTRETAPYRGTRMGAVYGVIATALILALMALGIRKRWRSYGVGSVLDLDERSCRLGAPDACYHPISYRVQVRYP